MASRSRNVRFELSSNVYEAFERHAQAKDMGTHDLFRRIAIAWLDENPAPDPIEDDAEA